MNVKTLYKFYCDTTALRIKKKAVNGFNIKGNKKRIIRINGDKKYNTDVFKFKDAQFIIRKRDNEQTIGDYKSIIKTTITDLDKSRNRSGNISSELSDSLLVNSDENFKRFTKDLAADYDQMMNNELQSDSDNDNDNDNDNGNDDDSDAESITSSTNSENVKPPIESDNEFRKWVDDNLYSISAITSETSDQTIQMILRGSDANGNPINNNDILYVDQILPEFYSAYLKEHRLPDDQQEKLEEIYINVIREGNYTQLKNKIENNKYFENFKKTENVCHMVHNITENCYNNFSSSNNPTPTTDTSTTSTSPSPSPSKTSTKPKKNSPITEEEYFDTSNTQSLHLGRVMEIDEEKRRIKNVLKCWLTKEGAFPLNCYHVKPLIDILCLIVFDQVNIKVEEKDYDRNIYYNLCKFVFKEIDGDKRFPLKFGKVNRKKKIINKL